RAWLELDGMPRYQVIRFQVIAASRAATTASSLACFGSTRPAPTVLATAVPVTAPKKFSAAAIRIAWSGVSTRVAITVAMALAVSWKPLMKSKTIPSATTTIRIVTSGILLDHGPQDVSHVFTPVGGVLDDLQDLLPAEQLEPVAPFLDQPRQCHPQHAVGLVLQSVDLDRALLDLGEPLLVRQERHGYRDLLGHLQDQAGQAPRPRHRLL